jgi:tRNA(adenine34) deaminase
MISKRAFLTSAGALICVAVSRPAPGQVPAISMARHEQFMRLAIDQARKNPVLPFGAVMVRPETGEVMARGVNRSGENPTFHGRDRLHERLCPAERQSGMEPARAPHDGRALFDVHERARLGGLGGVVFGSSIDGIRRAGIDQINITSKTVIDASPFYKGTLLGGVLQADRSAVHGPQEKLITAA